MNVEEVRETLILLLKRMHREGRSCGCMANHEIPAAIESLKTASDYAVGTALRQLEPYFEDYTQPAGR